MFLTIVGAQFAANLWVWNAPMEKHPFSPLNEDVKHPDFDDDKPQVDVVFQNSGKRYQEAELFVVGEGEEVFVAELNAHGKGEVAVTTVPDHTFVAKVNGEIVEEWTVGWDAQEYKFVL
jgi:hypothetical protein